MIACVLISLALAPHNVVLFVADGAGFHHFEAAGYYEYGESGHQIYDDWPVRVAMSTVPYGVVYDPELARTDAAWCRREATDSAAGITAMTTGFKTVPGRLAVDARGEPVAPLAELMADAGKATGVVTTVLFNHATPAGFCVSHADRSAYDEIAALMLSSSVDVIMGAGRSGDRGAWNALLAGPPWGLIELRKQFIALGEEPTPQRVLGLPPVYETLQEQRDGDVMADPFVVPLNPEVPTLAEMSRAALNVLDEDPDGFCLLVEGGAVDFASHDRRPGRMIEEMVDFNGAVAAVVTWLDQRGLLDETLLVVTADHETGFLSGPDPPAGTVWAPPVNRGRGVLPAFAFLADEHTRALVPLFARGPGSELLAARADQDDPLRGLYLDNAELGRVLSGIARKRQE
jgi:alkaline phosphatase